MTASVLIICLLVGSASAYVNLDCSDNATCVEQLTRDLVRSLRERKAVRLFDTVTIEPLSERQGRASRGLWDLVQNHAVSFDWNDFTFRLTVPKDGSDDALDLEMYEGRTAKDVSDTNSKKSSSKVEEESEEDKKAPKIGLRRRQKKKVLQAVIPLLFGMKSAGAVIFAFAIVSALTIKAAIASKLALLVTIGMAVKKLYESYSTGVGLQNHPYLYSQYPIDFPSASSHAYSVAGVSPQYASQEMYNPTAMGAHAHTHEILQSQDASAQQSQQAPTLLVNTTNAEQRWDGKSTLLKYLEPIIDGFKNVISPIANVFYGAIPTFRGLNSDVSTAKSVEADPADEIKKPKEYLVPQPRFIAQRKNFIKNTIQRPKKHVELKINLDRLKHNKDLHDYIKTKKYKYNYPNTYYYPRIKYVVNPNSFYIKPNNSRLIPYRRSPDPTTTDSTTLPYSQSDWKPIIVFNNTTPLNATRNQHTNITRRNMNKNFFLRKTTLTRRKRIKRDLSTNTKIVKENGNESRGIFNIFSFLEFDPISSLIDRATEYTKTVLKSSVAMQKKEPPVYYNAVYNLLMMSLDILDGIFSVEEEVHKHYFQSAPIKTKKKVIKKKKKPLNKSNDNIITNNDTLIHDNSTNTNNTTT